MKALALVQHLPEGSDSYGILGLDRVAVFEQVLFLAQRHAEESGKHRGWFFGLDKNLTGLEEKVDGFVAWLASDKGIGACKKIADHSSFETNQDKLSLSDVVAAGAFARRGDYARQIKQIEAARDGSRVPSVFSTKDVFLLCGRELVCFGQKKAGNVLILMAALSTSGIFFSLQEEKQTAKILPYKPRVKLGRPSAQDPRGRPQTGGPSLRLELA